MPWLAAPTRSGTTCASAPRHTSATRWLTSTLPAPTATGGTAATTVPAGAITRTGRMRAAVRRDRRVGDGADRERDRAHGHRLDRVHVARPLRVGAGEVERRRRRRRPSASTTMRVGDCCSGRGPAESSTSSNVPATVGQVARAPRACGARRSRGSRRAARRRPSASTISAHARDAEPVGAALRVEVAAPLVGRARARATIAVDDVVVERRRREAQPFLVDGRARRAASSPARCHRRRRGARGWRPSRPARRRRSTGDTIVTSLRCVPPANGSLSTISSPAQSRCAIAAATDAGIEPRCTGMCSACASSSPAAVNSAAEQSARSLMLGLNAARRSTAPISSATDASRETEDLQRGRVHARSTHPRAGRARASARQPVGDPHRAVGLGHDRRARRTRARSTAREVADRRAARHARRGPAARRPRPARRAARTRCAARARRGSRRRSATVSSWLWPAYRQSSERLDVAAAAPAPPRSRRERGRARRRGRRATRGVGHDSHELALLGRRTGARRPRTRRRAAGTIDRAHPERVGDRARVERSGATERDQRELARVDALLDRDHAHRALHRRVDDRDHAVGGRRRHASSAARAASTSRRPSPGSVGVGRDAPEHEVGVGDRRPRSPPRP